MPTIPKSPSRVSWSTREFIQSVANSQPAERMIVLAVDVWKNDAGEIEHVVHRLPVVGLETSLVHRWSRRDCSGEPDGREYSSERELQDADAGYRFQHEEVRRDVVVLNHDSDDGELATLTDLRESQSDTYLLRLIVCDWPKPEDESRLAPIVSEAVAEMTAHIRQESQQPIGGRTAS